MYFYHKNVAGDEFVSIDLELSEINAMYFIIS